MGEELTHGSTRHLRLAVAAAIRARCRETTLSAFGMLIGGQKIQRELRLMPTVVETSLGKLKGSRSGSVDVFRGVPFAAPPVGDLRFSGPMAASPWAGEREAVAFGPVSFQPMDPLAVMFPSTECNFYHPGAEQSEDCLYLNVWAPAERQAQLRPVLIWIHGGAYVCGSGSGLWTDGTRLAAEQDVVVVTLNYRLGALGGLAVDDDARSANNMLRDQLGRAALDAGKHHGFRG